MGEVFFPLFLIMGAGVAVAVVMLAYVSDRRRQQGFQLAAARLGLAFTYEDPFGLLDLPFELLTRGDGRGVENILYGTWQGMAVQVFDYWYYEETSNGKTTSRTTYRFSCVVTPIDARCPHLTIAPENLLTRLADALALDDLQFESEAFRAIDLRDAFQVAGDPALRRERTAMDLVRDVPRLTPRTPLDEVMRRFSRLELAQLPVVNAQDPDRLLGTVARRDVLAALDREVVRRRVLLARFLEEGGTGEADGARRAGDLNIREVAVPDSWSGTTLGDCDPYGKYGVFVLAVRRVEGELKREFAPVGPDWKLGPAERLVLLGKTVDLDRDAGGGGERSFPRCCPGG